MSLLRRIVLVTNKPQVHQIAQAIAHEVFMADDLPEALDMINTAAPDMTVFDETFAPQAIRRLLQEVGDIDGRPHLAVLAGSPHMSFPPQEYEKAGIARCLLCDEDYPRLHQIAAQASQPAPQPPHATAEADYFVDDTAAAAGMVGRSKAMQRAVEVIRLVAASRCNPVLVVGETGTGKELAARAVHLIRHPAAPFVAVNCAALTANLLESELFGHVKGSFTGADRDKTGLLELAGEGTIFLDEISEMPLELQAKLLRVLQDKTFRKVGGIKDLACTATIIASSNRNLKKEVEEKRFRQDLYYRLNICPILLAPLRSPGRRGDIRLLTEYFLRTSNICGAKRGKIVAITQMALEALQRHHWPGNIRELRNVIERAILFETTDKIGLNSIVIEPTECDGGVPEPTGRTSRDFSLEKAERELIARALHETGWQKTQAASLLGITRATLYAKVKQYDIRKNLPEQADATVDGHASIEPEPATIG